MDELKMEKLQAMKEYKKNQFLNKLAIYFFTFLTSALFCSSPHWIPFVISSLNVLFTPKCLFIVCNFIVAFLIRQSKLMSSKSSPPTDFYEEFVSHSGSLRSPSQEKVKEMKFEPSLIREREMGNVQDDEEDEIGLPAEELHKRADDLIARVNKQRRMELPQLY